MAHRRLPSASCPAASAATAPNVSRLHGSNVAASRLRQPPSRSKLPPRRWPLQRTAAAPSPKPTCAAKALKSSRSTRPPARRGPALSSSVRRHRKRLIASFCRDRPTSLVHATRPPMSVCSVKWSPTRTCWPSWRPMRHRPASPARSTRVLRSASQLKATSSMKSAAPVRTATGSRRPRLAGPPPNA